MFSVALCTASCDCSCDDHVTGMQCHVTHSNGQKMSKRLKNYPDPMNVVRDYGADALRLYLVNSPVVRAESLRLVGGAWLVTRVNFNPLDSRRKGLKMW